MNPTIFQTQEYLKVIKKSNEEIFYFSYTKDNFYFFNVAIKTPINGTPYFDISSPYGYAGYYSNTSDENFLQEAMLAQTQKASQENIIAEFIRFHPHFPNITILEKYLDFFTKEKEIVVVDPSKRWELYTPRLRSKIRKSLSQLTITKSIDIKKFFELYTETMHRNHATQFYFFDFDYFSQLSKLKSFEMYAATIENHLCAMAIFLKDHYASYYYLGANSKITLSNNLNAMGAILEFFFNLHQDTCCILGGGRSNDPQDSLLHFKKHFSPILLPFYIGGKIYNHKIYHQLCKNYHNPFFLKYRFK